MQVFQNEELMHTYQCNAENFTKNAEEDVYENERLVYLCSDLCFTASRNL